MIFTMFFYDIYDVVYDIFDVVYDIYDVVYDIVTILFLHKSPHLNLLFHIISSNIKALIITNNKVFYTFVIEICRVM